MAEEIVFPASAGINRIPCSGLNNCRGVPRVSGDKTE
ncbi:hypothetical protein ECMG_03175 [Escherichia coli TA143]|nr:hypothetical protein ECMG_03175 [Escherichia coli TA143]